MWRSAVVLGGFVIAAPVVAMALPDSTGTGPATPTTALRPIPVRQVAATSTATSPPASKKRLRAAKLVLSVKAPARARKGGRYTYTVRVSNRGPGTPSAVVVRNMLPKGVVRTGAHLPNGVGGQADGRFGEFVLYKLRPGKTLTMRLTVKAKRSGRLQDNARVTFVEGARSTMPKARAVTIVR